MKPLTQCPFCNDVLTKKEEKPRRKEAEPSQEVQYLCRGKDDHTYIQVHFDDPEPEVYHLKIRVGPGEVRYYFSAYYMGDSFTNVSMWEGRHNEGERLRLEEEIYPDLSLGVQGMVDFIKMHLVFN